MILRDEEAYWSCVGAWVLQAFIYYHFFPSSYATINMTVDKLYHIYLYIVKAKGLIKKKKSVSCVVILF